MELRHLRYFLKSAELLHFTQAAAALHVSQPTLSLQIRQLEEELGSQLFERKGRAVHLTESGELFLAHARRALKEIEAGQQRVQDLNCLLGGTLRIGVTYSFSADLLPGILAEFTQSHPAVRIQVSNGTNYGVEAGVCAGEFDLGLLCQNTGASGLSSQELFEEEIVVVVSRKHRLAKFQTLRMRDLDKVRLALPTSDFRTRQLIDAAFESAGGHPDVIIEANDIDVLLGVARTGVAATMVTRQAAAHLHSDDISRIPLKEKGLRLQAAFVWPRAGYVKPAAKRFVELAMEYVAGTHSR